MRATIIFIHLKHRVELKIYKNCKHTCNENSYSDGNNCATAPTASSAIFIQSASDNETILGVKHDHRPASVISLQPASSNSNNDWKINKKIY